MTLKTCVICGKEFIPKSSNQKCCSDDCCIENRRIRGRAKTGYQKSCHVCGKMFIVSRQRKLYCSDECKEQYNLERELNNQKGKNQEKKCVVCGKTFKTKLSHKICCSEECRIQRKKEVDKEYYKKTCNSSDTKRYTKICPICNNTFTTNHRNKKCCSDKCYGIYNVILKNARHQRFIRNYTKTCPVCGQVFTTNKIHKICCSKECGIIRKRNADLQRQRERRLEKNNIEGNTLKPTSYTKTCPECGKVFTADKPAIKYCSVECKEYAVERRKFKYTKVCVICGKSFRTNSQYKIRCSQYCISPAKKVKTTELTQLKHNNVLDKVMNFFKSLTKGKVVINNKYSNKGV